MNTDSEGRTPVLLRFALSHSGERILTMEDYRWAFPICVHLCPSVVTFCMALVKLVRLGHPAAVIQM